MRPLKWWLNESKQYSRAEHQTMPTLTAVIHRSPSTPWKTVEDPFPRRKKLREVARGGKGKEARLAQEGAREDPSPGRWDDESD
ncbi:hypothetical protein H632_c1831p0 [Helicosporidium sp. ATCC 50920]|nr:hypothetical protein H632_c1831p0 [Helicosporidium sp. ATCC 50920]|eukprot:KDD73794.1 hypothetical protein H632_c1831p0 [Helicosporidium sp. ATCC 50920]